MFIKFFIIILFYFTSLKTYSKRSHNVYNSSIKPHSYFSTSQKELNFLRRAKDLFWQKVAEKELWQDKTAKPLGHLTNARQHFSDEKCSSVRNFSNSENLWFALNFRGKNSSPLSLSSGLPSFGRLALYVICPFLTALLMHFSEVFSIFHQRKISISSEKQGFNLI